MNRLSLMGLTLVLASPLAAQWTEGGANIGANLDTLTVTFQGMGTVFNLAEDFGAARLDLIDTAGVGGVSMWAAWSTSGSRLALYGDNSIIFRTYNTTLDKVALPQDAIQSLEIADEPGVAATGFGSPQSLPSGVSTILTQTIVAPESGYLFVVASGEVSVSHNNGASDHAYFGVNVGDSVLPSNQQITVWVSPALPTASFYYPVTPNGIFPVGPGTHTVYFASYVFNGTYTVDDVQLSVIYIPTAYGTVAKSAPKAGDDAAGTFVRPSVQAERQRAEAANQARIQAEIREIRKRLAELETEMRPAETR